MSRGLRHLCLMSRPVCVIIRMVIEGRECRGQTERQPFRVQTHLSGTSGNPVKPAWNVVIWMSVMCPLDPTCIPAINVAQYSFNDRGPGAARYVYSISFYKPYRNSCLQEPV